MTPVTQSEAAPTKAKGAEPIWFASYPAGMPRTIDPDAYPSLSAMLIEACRATCRAPRFRMLERADDLCRVGSR